MVRDDWERRVVDDDDCSRLAMLCLLQMSPGPPRPWPGAASARCRPSPKDSPLPLTALCIPAASAPARPFLSLVSPDGFYPVPSSDRQALTLLDLFDCMLHLTFLHVTRPVFAAFARPRTSSNSPSPCFGRGVGKVAKGRLENGWGPLDFAVTGLGAVTGFCG